MRVSLNFSPGAALYWYVFGSLGEGQAAGRLRLQDLSGPDSLKLAAQPNPGLGHGMLAGIF